MANGILWDRGVDKFSRLDIIKPNKIRGFRAKFYGMTVKTEEKFGQNHTRAKGKKRNKGSPELPRDQDI